MNKRAFIYIFIAIFASEFKILNMDKTGVWLAEQLGVTAVTVSKWCSNITQPTLPTLDKIAELLECELRDLIIE